MPGFYTDMPANFTSHVEYAQYGAGKYSPVTLNQEWPRLARLVVVSLIFVFSCLMNSFYVASFCIERSLRKAGYIFMVCAGISDMIVTTGIFPTVSVVLLSDYWDNLYVCRILQIAAEWSCYGYSLSFMIIGIETVLRTCSSKHPYQLFLAMQINFVAVLIMVGSLALAAVGVYYQLDYDYCNREFIGHSVFRFSTMLLCHVIPGAIALITLFISTYRIQRRYRTNSVYQRSRQYVWDSMMTNLNIFSFIMHILFWSPYVYFVYFQLDINDARYYGSAWFGLVRTVVTNPIYGLVAHNFRHTYSRLIRYICCRTYTRNIYYGSNCAEYYRPGQIRVHVMQPTLTSRPRLTNVQETNL